MREPLEIKDVRHIANLANLQLSPAEEEHLQGQLNLILDYCQRLDHVDTSKVEALSHSITQGTPFSEEMKAAATRLSQNAALSGAPDSELGQFRVPAVIE